MLSSRGGLRWACGPVFNEYGPEEEGKLKVRMLIPFIPLIPPKNRRRSYLSSTKQLSALRELHSTPKLQCVMS